MENLLSVGMTIGLRKNGGTTYQYAEQAIESFRKAGFTQPLHLFVEPGAKIHVPQTKKLGLIPHHSTEKLGCFPNFKRGAQFLVDADWILMLQDDAVWCDGAMELFHAAINNPDFQQVGFISPYTSKAMVARDDKVQLKKAINSGNVMQQWVDCHFHNRAFWGAVAMAFPRASLVKMQTKGRRYMNHKHNRKLDVVVGNTIRHDLDMPILVASPSLVDHIGKWSTLGRHKLKGNQWGRRGFAFQGQE
jgi:hypothetical protein